MWTLKRIDGQTSAPGRRNTWVRRGRRNDFKPVLRRSLEQTTDSCGAAVNRRSIGLAPVLAEVSPGTSRLILRHNAAKRGSSLKRGIQVQLFGHGVKRRRRQVQSPGYRQPGEFDIAGNVELALDLVVQIVDRLDAQVQPLCDFLLAGG